MSRLALPLRIVPDTESYGIFDAAGVSLAYFYFGRLRTEGVSARNRVSQRQAEWLATEFVRVIDSEVGARRGRA